MELEGIHHVSLNVHDAAETARFYEEVLELRRLERPDFGFPGAWFEMDDGRQVHLIEVGSGHRAPGGQHFAIRVRDIDEQVAALRDRGVEIGDPHELPGAGRQAFFKDPAGNEIELNQPSA
jgi:glyoxylase I family protein